MLLHYAITTNLWDYKFMCLVQEHGLFVKQCESVIPIYLNVCF
jgi:hypothetical protein